MNFVPKCEVFFVKPSNSVSLGNMFCFESPAVFQKMHIVSSLQVRSQLPVTKKKEK